jgi:hypothetical protein
MITRICIRRTRKLCALPQTKEQIAPLPNAMVLGSVAKFFRG